MRHFSTAHPVPFVRREDKLRRGDWEAEVPEETDEQKEARLRTTAERMLEKAKELAGMREVKAKAATKIQGLPKIKKARKELKERKEVYDRSQGKPTGDEIYEFSEEVRKRFRKDEPKLRDHLHSIKRPPTEIIYIWRNFLRDEFKKKYGVYAPTYSMPYFYDSKDNAWRDSYSLAVTTPVYERYAKFNKYTHN
jgi:hypothetical protein